MKVKVLKTEKTEKLETDFRNYPIVLTGGGGGDKISRKMEENRTTNPFQKAVLSGIAHATIEGVLDIFNKTDYEMDASARLREGRARVAYLNDMTAQNGVDGTFVVEVPLGLIGEIVDRYVEITGALGVLNRVSRQVY